MPIDLRANSMTELSVTAAGIRLENPLILASGILDENGYTMKRVLEEGAGAVVTKSIGSVERPGYSTPVVVDLPGGNLLNAVGLANPGIGNFGEEIKIALEAHKPLIGSIFGSGPDEYAALALSMQNYGATAVELNLSCPHVNGTGLEMGSDPEMVEAIIGAVKNRVRIPVLAKLSPNVSNMLEIAHSCSRADSVVVINTIKGMAIDINARKPVLSNVYGGLSGNAVKYVGLRYVYEIKKETGFDVIGVGGIATAADVLEYIMAGASAVQIGTAVGRYGREIFSRISRDLDVMVDQMKVEKLADLKGAAL